MISIRSAILGALVGALFACAPPAAQAQVYGGGGSAGTAGCDFSGIYPRQTVISSNCVPFGTAAFSPLTALLQSANNLSDVASAATARTNLGVPALTQAWNNMMGTSVATAQPAATTNFYALSGASPGSGTEANRQQLSQSGTIQDFYFRALAAPAGADTFVATIKINGSNSTVTCTITGAATTCNDLFGTTTHSATVTAGQTVDMSVVSSATATATGFLWSAKFYPATN